VIVKYLRAPFLPQFPTTNVNLQDLLMQSPPSSPEEEHSCDELTTIISSTYINKNIVIGPFLQKNSEVSAFDA